MHIPFQNDWVNFPEKFFRHIEPAKVPAPSLLAFNHGLAAELGITYTDNEQELAGVYSGQHVPSNAAPIALAYAGHQFGNFVPSLGDGRAVLLGQVRDQSGGIRDIQLKGSGRTPFSRGGDGKAWLGPVLREYVLSEAMHALGIPTTRALAAVTTGETILRQEGPMPGAIVTRVASSHIRIGTFQYFAARGDIDGVRVLFEAALRLHYPDVSTPLELLKAVAQRQIELVAKWLGVGFIHGVMNTDNTTISGETIDYGPCAFMDRYHPMTVYSSIDRMGRYAYGNQTQIIAWNLAQLGSCLLLLEADQDAALPDYQAAIDALPAASEAAWLQVFGAKIGLSNPTEDDRALINEFLELLTLYEGDFTNSFRSLSNLAAPDAMGKSDAFSDWQRRWKARLACETNPSEIMRAANSAFIPRNHRIEEMIQEALVGNMAPFDRLMRVLADPYTDQPDEVQLTAPPKPEEEVEATFCGT